MASPGVPPIHIAPPPPKSAAAPQGYYYGGPSAPRPAPVPAPQTFLPAPAPAIPLSALAYPSAPRPAAEHKTKGSSAPFVLSAVITGLAILLGLLVYVMVTNPPNKLEPGLTLPAGFDIERGTFRVFNTDFCALLPSCFGQNPDAPYGRPIFRARTLLDPASALGAFDLEPSEAVLVYGRTPRHTRYYGFTLYLFDRAEEGGARKILFASLGDSINSHQIEALDGSTEPDFVLIVAANPVIAERLRRWFRRPWFRKRLVLVLPVPSNVVRAGDRLMLLLRTAFDDPNELAGFLGDPHIETCRLQTYKFKSDVYTLSAGDLTPRSAQNAEDALQPFLEQRVAALLQTLGDNECEYDEVPVHAFLSDIDYDSGLDCIRYNRACLGDNRDATYTLSDEIALRAKQAIVVVGANHTRASRATYTTVTLYNADTQDDLGAAFRDTEFGDGPIYAVAFSLSGEFDFLGVPRHAFVVAPHVVVAERAYAELPSKIGPAYASILHPRVFVVRRRREPRIKVTLDEQI